PVKIMSRRVYGPVRVMTRRLSLSPATAT
ncbi:hypothetical protein RvY_17567, partial [Ramazzottius varieornatus]